MELLARSTVRAIKCIAVAIALPARFLAAAASETLSVWFGADFSTWGNLLALQTLPYASRPGEFGFPALPRWSARRCSWDAPGSVGVRSRDRRPANQTSDDRFPLGQRRGAEFRVALGEAEIHSAGVQARAGARIGEPRPALARGSPSRRRSRAALRAALRACDLAFDRVTITRSALYVVSVAVCMLPSK
jgi:hypothetical protein